MAQHRKILDVILSGSSDSNIPFSGLCNLLLHLGFTQRIRGSHHIFSKEDVEEIINLQPNEGKGKSYQVKQVRKLILQYRLTPEESDNA